MSEQARKVSNAKQRAGRTRSNISGTAQRPRLSVNISNKHISAQIINDDLGKTIASVSTVGLDGTHTMTDKAVKVGSEIAKKAKSSKISKVVFDRGSKQYHGRMKALAEAARDNGLEF